MPLSSPHKTEAVLLAIALTFHLSGAALLAAQGHSLQETWPWIVALAVCALSGLLWSSRATTAHDPLLLPVTILLSGWGLLVIARVAPNFLGRQIIWLLIAQAALLAVVAGRDTLRWLRRFKYTWLILSLALLAATLFLGVNPAGAGARLWLSIGGLFIQPSEVMRLLMIAFLAAFLGERAGEQAGRFHATQTVDRLPIQTAASPAARHFAELISRAVSRLVRIEHVRAVAPSIFMWLIAIALLTTQQDLGAAALLLITFVSILYLASGRAALPLLGLAALMIGGTGGYMMSARVAQRIDIWLNPWLDPQNRSFQIVQSLIAVASGSVFGAGIGSGQPGYVPAVHTDFPFAAIGEEMGLAGMIGLIAAFGVLVLRGWRIARRAKTSYGMLLAGGLSASFTAQVCVIIGGNLGLLPLTGVTLPFISYGGSSLLVSFISVGLLLRLSADGEMSTKGEDRLRPRAPEAFLPSPAQHAASRRAMRLSAALFAVISLAAGYWAVLRSAELVARSDNPRLIDAERAIRRGPILAHDGTTLAYSVPAQQGDQLTHLTPYTRRYPHPEVGPVVGYSSWRHGAGGLERHADAILRGSLSSLERLLHRPQFGAAFTTTLDLALQSQLHRALTGYVGGAIVLEARTGEVLALSSAPSFDPNRLDEEWDALRADARAPLLNRVTQALYQPGRLLQWLYEAESGAPGGQAWDAGDRFRLGQPVPFELENAYTPYPSTVTYSETIGQGQLRITPLRVAVAVAELLAGRLVTPTLSKRISESSAVNLPAAGAKIDLRQPLVFFAQNGPRQFVGWLIMAIDGRVVVIGLEQSDTSATRLRAIAAQMRAALE